MYSHLARVLARQCSSAALSNSVLAPLAAELPSSKIRDVMDLAWALEQKLEGTGGRLIKLEVGQPDFAAPATAVKATQEAAAEQLHQGYIPNAGLLTLRQSIASMYHREHPALAPDGGGSDSPMSIAAENVTVTTGAVGAISTLLHATVESGDEVLIPDPCW
eukprot:gene25937-34817_t